MKESIMSFFNAPITNKVPSGVCSVAGLHVYISSDSHLKELTQRVRADTENDKAFRGKKADFTTLRHACRNLFVLSGAVYHGAVRRLCDRHRSSCLCRRGHDVARPTFCWRSATARPCLRKSRCQRSETLRALPAESHGYTGTLVRQCSTHRLGLSGMASRTKGRYCQCRYVESLLPGIRCGMQIKN